MAVPACLWGQTTRNPLNAHGDNGWARLRAQDQNILVATVKVRTESTNLAGEHRDSSEELVVKKLVDSVLVKSLSQKTTMVLSSVNTFGVENLPDGAHLLRTPILTGKDWGSLRQQPTSQIVKEDLPFYREYMQCVGRLQLPYCFLTVDGNMDLVFPESTNWSGPETVDYSGRSVCEFLFNAPKGLYFSTPTTGRILLDQNHDMRWLLMEHGEFVDGNKVGDYRYTIDYASDDSRVFKFTREFNYVRDGDLRFGTRDIAEVTKTFESPDPREFTLAYYGIILQNNGSSGRAWLWIVTIGAACLLIAIAMYLRRRSVT